MQRRNVITWSMGAATGLLPSAAFATTTAGALPWEGPLSLVQQSLTGPVAGILSLIAIFVAGATLVFAGEIGDFAKRLVYIVLVVGIMALSGAAYTNLFSGAAATIGKHASQTGNSAIYLLLAVGSAVLLRGVRSMRRSRKRRMIAPVIAGA